MAVDPEHVNATALIPVDHGGYPREVYAVQGVRATLDPNRGWQCTCKDYAQGLQCIHVEQAHAFRQMRGAKRDDDTIEMELSAEDLQALHIAAAGESTDSPPIEPVATSKRVLRHSRWAAVVAAAGIAGISSGVTYLATVRAQPIRVAEQSLPEALAAPTPAAPAPPPVRFANPFDATEVFELAPGMSESDARDAVAELLLSRARQRLAASAAMPGRSDKAFHHGKTPRTTRLANRS